MTTKRQQQSQDIEEEWKKRSENLLSGALSAGAITEVESFFIAKYAESVYETLSSRQKYWVILTLICARDYFPEYFRCSQNDVATGIYKVIHATNEIGELRFNEDEQRDILAVVLAFIYFAADELKKAIESGFVGEYECLAPLVISVCIENPEIRKKLKWL